MGSTTSTRYECGPGGTGRLATPEGALVEHLEQGTEHYPEVRVFIGVANVLRRPPSSMVTARRPPRYGKPRQGVYGLHSNPYRGPRERHTGVPPSEHPLCSCNRLASRHRPHQPRVREPTEIPPSSPPKGAEVSEQSVGSFLPFTLSRTACGDCQTCHPTHQFAVRQAEHTDRSQRDSFQSGTLCRRPRCSGQRRGPGNAQQKENP